MTTRSETENDSLRESVQKLFQFHGVPTTDKPINNGHLQTDCRFCGKEDHFYIQMIGETEHGDIGSWDCKACGESGNKYTFLQMVFKDSLETTKPTHYKKLANFRRSKSHAKPGLPPAAYANAGLAWDPVCCHWVIPIKNPKGSYVNLKTYNTGVSDPYPCATPSCKTHLFNSEYLGSSRLARRKIIILCEGEWDVIAMSHLLGQLPKGHDLHISKVAVVGSSANGIPKYELPCFQKKEVWVCYDHDDAGEKGLLKVAKQLYALPRPPKSVKTLRWPESATKGYDLCNYISSSQQKPHVLIDEIQDFLEEVEEPSYDTKNGKLKDLLKKEDLLPTVERKTFSRVIKDFKDNGVSMNRKMEDGLAIAFATILASKSQGDPLWMFIIGPSGCGKSLLLEAALESPDVVYRTTIGAKDFLSGMKGDHDPSLLGRLLDPSKCLLIKDYTGIITLPHNELEELYGIFREAYDGLVSRSWGNKVSREYEGYFGVLAGVTPKIHTLNHTALGERFLKYQVASSNSVNKQHQILAAMSGGEGGADAVHRKRFRQASVRSFLYHRYQDKTKIELSREHYLRLASLAQLTAICRARVDRDRNGAINYEASPESGTRLGKQFTKLAVYLCKVFGQGTPNSRVLDIVAQVAWDTGYDRKRDVIAYAYANPDGVFKKELEDKLNIPSSTAARCLEDLMELKVLYRRRNPNRDKTPGRPAFIYKLRKSIREIYSLCDFEWSRSETLKKEACNPPKSE